MEAEEFSRLDGKAVKTMTKEDLIKIAGTLATGTFMFRA